MDKKKRVEEIKQELREGLDQLESADIEELSDDDLDSVAGGCSTWCCSSDENDAVHAN